METDRLERLDRALTLALDLAPEAVTPDLSAETSAAWDLAGHLRIVLAVEESFGVTFTIDDIERATSRAALIALLEGKLSAR